MDTFFVDIYEIGNLTYRMLKIASYDPMDTVIEFLGQS